MRGGAASCDAEMVEVFVSADAATQIAALPHTMARRVRTIVARLYHWPAVSGAKPLRGALAGRYRARAGDYRVQFRVDTVRQADEEGKVTKDYRIFVEKVGHRDGFYD
jgi:mRNA-degrading endonuclease RelE of RelBE toxin-antitoxin system